MSTENRDPELTRLYHNTARVQSPAWLDTHILAAAARHARAQKARARLRLLAVAAAIAGLAIGIPQWEARHRERTSGTVVLSINPHSPLAEALRNLRVPRVDTSVVARCLRRSDLCSDKTAIAH